MQNAQQEQDLGRLRRPGGADRNNLDRAALVSAPSKHTAFKRPPHRHLEQQLFEISHFAYLAKYLRSSDCCFVVSMTAVCSRSWLPGSQD